MGYKVKSLNIYLIIVYNRTYEDNTGKNIIQRMADTFSKLMKGNNPQNQEVKLFPIGKTKRHGDKFIISSE